MEIGIFTSTFDRSNLEETLDTVAEHGITSVQFDMSSAGFDDMPHRLETSSCDDIRSALSSRGIRMAGLSGTFNMIHPDVRERTQGLERLEVLASSCDRLGTGIITICTGTRDADHMWSRHPDNDTPEAWADLAATLERAVAIAEKHDVALAFEPEVNNVIDSAEKARKIIDQVGSSHLKVVIDGANLFHAGELPRMTEILDHAFDTLGDDIVMAHAKDLSRDGDAGHEAAGTGLLDYDHYVHLLRQMDFQGALVLHSLDESQVDSCLAFLRGKI